MANFMAKTASMKKELDQRNEQKEKLDLSQAVLVGLS